MRIQPDTRREYAVEVWRNVESIREYLATLEAISMEIMHTNYQDPHGRLFHTSFTIDKGDGMTIETSVTVKLPGWEEERDYHAEKVRALLDNMEQ